MPSTDVIQLTSTVKITTAHVVETSITVLFRTAFTRTIMLHQLMKCFSWKDGQDYQCKIGLTPIANPQRIGPRAVLSLASNHLEILHG